MFGHVTSVRRMSRDVADCVGHSGSHQARIVGAVLGVVRVPDVVAERARVGRQIDVADGLHLRRRAAGSVLRVIRMFG